MAQRSAEGPPPSSETGVEMPTAPVVGLGWISGTFVGRDPGAALDILRPYFGEGSARDFGTRFYGASSVLDDGRVMVGWDGHGGAAGSIFVNVRQGALDGLGWDRSVALAGSLLAAGFRPSRVDVYVDDRAGITDPAAVYAAFSSGEVVTHAREGEWRENTGGGATAALGRRTSERYLRVYRKHEDGDARTRWELETKGTLAGFALGLVVSAPDPMATALQLLVSFVDFRARVGEAHGSRAERLDWWAAFVGSLGKVRAAAAVRIDSLARRVAWLRRQAAPSLWAVYVRLGADALNDLLRQGSDRPPAWLVAGG